MSTQYRVSTASRLCFAKKVLVKPESPWMGLFWASAHHDVNSKELDVARALLASLRLLDVLAARRVAVVLRQRAVADDEDLHVFKQSGTRPEALPRVAIDLIERLSDVDAAPLELDVDERQTIDQHSHVVSVAAGGAALTLADLVLIDDLEPVVMDVDLVDQLHVLRAAVVTGEQLDVVFLDAPGLVLGGVIAARDAFDEESLPLSVGEGDAVQGLELPAEIGNKLRLSCDRQVLVGLGLKLGDELLLKLRLRLVGGLASHFRDELGNDRALRADRNRLVATGQAVGSGSALLSHAASSKVSSLSR